MDTITLKEMEFYSHVGCLDFEKRDGQTFIVTVKMSFQKIRGCYTDELSDTCDYSVIYERIRHVVTSADCDLIERLAQMICDCIFESDPDVLVCECTVSKPNAPVDGKFKTMEVNITRTRDED